MSKILMPTEADFARYAELAVKKGVNIQPGQQLEVRADISQAPLVRHVVKAAYAAGAKQVFVNWSDEETGKIRYFNAPADSFKEFPDWLKARFEQLAEEKTAFLSIVSDDPDALNGVESSRISDANRAAGQALAKWRQYVRSDNVSWSIVEGASEA